MNPQVSGAGSSLVLGRPDGAAEVKACASGARGSVDVVQPAAVTTHLSGDVLIIDVRVNPASERELLDFVREQLAEGRRKFVVNLAELRWLDSAGLGGLAGAFTAATRHDGRLVLASPQPAIESLLDHTKLATIIPVYSSEHDALASFDAASSFRADTPEN